MKGLHYHRSNHSYTYSISTCVLIIVCCCVFSSIVFAIAFTLNSNYHCHYYDGPKLKQTRFVDESSMSHKRQNKFLSSSLFQHNDEMNSDEEEPRNSDHHYNEHRESEFRSIEPKAHSPQHQKRIEEEEQAQNTFVQYGNELWDLRSTLIHLSKQLIHIMARKYDISGTSTISTSPMNVDSDITPIISEEDIREMIREVEAKDPELVYALERERMERAMEEDRIVDAQQHKQKALNARNALPHFNLHGLWVGNYGTSFEMVNITYVGDTLIARKVTGDGNVPAGEITFQADLSPPKPSQLSIFSKENKHTNNMKEPLSNILLSEEAAKKWNTKELPRFPGLGQVAEHGFRDNQWMDGQFVFVNNDYFSFAWMPLNHQILFGRPSRDLTLKMLISHQQKNENSYNHQDYDEEDDEELCKLPPTLYDDIDTLNKHVVQCFDATLSLIEECYLHDDSSSCIFYVDDADVCCFE